MSPSQITANLNAQLPSIFIAVNPKGVRELANRAGRPYLARVDETLAALNDPKARNYDAPIREISFKHARRQVTVFFATVRGLEAADFPKLRALAVSVDCDSAEDPDRLLVEYVAALKAAVEVRGQSADKALQELTGTSLMWDADA